MIPRRRIDLGAPVAGELLRAPFAAAAADRGDVARLEAALAAYLGVRAVRATASGRDALELIIDALGLSPGDEIVVPAYTLGELIPLLTRRGLVPRAAEVEPDSLNLGAAGVAAQLGPRTRAILALHIFGAPCDIAAIAALARRRGIALVEDCAHALGARVAGRPVGGFGRAALFSLEVSKQLPTFGGGLVASDDAELVAHIDRQLALRPARLWPAWRKAAMKCAEELAVRSPLYRVAAPLLFGDARAGGFEARYRRLHDRVRAGHTAYTGFQARLGLARLDALDERNARLNARWERLAASLPAGFRAQRRDRHGSPAFYNFVALYAGDAVSLRRRALALGLDLGIGSEVMDDVAPALGQSDCPVAAAAARGAVQIPLYDGLAEARFERLARRLAQAAQAA